MLLVTTALENTWGTNEKILFLGEWCKLYIRKDIWENRQSETLPDPWSNRERRFQAYLYTEDIYKSTISELANTLNNVHGTTYPVRYWKILCGPWLRLFINSLYHKWECINDAIPQYNVNNTFLVEGIDDKHIPFDMFDFEGIMVSDQWNHYLSGLIINEIGLSVGLNIAKPIYEGNALSVFQESSYKARLLSMASGFAIKLFNRKAAVFISQPYLPKVMTLLLGARLHSVPRYSASRRRSVNKEFNKSIRSISIQPYIQKTKFEKFLKII